MKSTARCGLLIIILLVVVGGLGWRVISLHVFEQNFLRHQGEVRTIRVVSTAPYRGMITDRNGEPLAISTPVDSVWLNPKEFDAEHPQVFALASILDLSLEQLLDKFTKNINREFVYLQRHVTPKIAEQVKALAVTGVHLKPEYKRYYPAGEVASHVLGFTNIDGGGQEGVELAFDQWLGGSAGSKRIIQDRRGREVQTLEGIKDMQPGKDVMLSLDQRLQYLAYRELKMAVSAHNAVAGSAVILDVKTGEILAMVNQPSFNPNMRIKLHTDGRFRNRAVTDVFEPGSVMKTFSVASALQNGRFTPATMVDTSPGWLSIGGHPVREIKNKNFGMINVQTILQKSSNVGVTKLTLSLPPETLWSTYSNVGFGKATGCGFPGESSGMLICPSKKSSFALATLSFGYGMSVTPLQLAQAYAVLGAGGVKRPVTFLKQISQQPGEQVMEPEVARQVVEMLKGVVAQGSGTQAQVLGYQTAGKTGTTRKINPTGGYLVDSHVALFAGVAPANHPRFAIVVLVDDPKGDKYYGSQIAAPIFSKIAAGALRIFNIAPDVVDTQNLQVARVNNSSSLHE
jgi:cell division protein FtsI (penicillin-binding protein 3)